MSAGTRVTTLSKRSTGWYDVMVDGQVVGRVKSRRPFRRSAPLWDATPLADEPARSRELLDFRTREQAVAALVRWWEDQLEEEAA